jgi:hypothetical protein
MGIFFIFLIGYWILSSILDRCSCNYKDYSFYTDIVKSQLAAEKRGKERFGTFTYLEP